MILAVNSSNFGLDLLEVVGKLDKNLPQKWWFFKVMYHCRMGNKNNPKKIFHKSRGGCQPSLNFPILRDETMQIYGKVLRKFLYENA